MLWSLSNVCLNMHIVHTLNFSRRRWRSWKGAWWRRGWRCSSMTSKKCKSIHCDQWSFWSWWSCSTYICMWCHYPVIAMMIIMMPQDCNNSVENFPMMESNLANQAFDTGGREDEDEAQQWSSLDQQKWKRSFSSWAQMRQWAQKQQQTDRSAPWIWVICIHMYLIYQQLYQAIKFKRGFSLMIKQLFPRE